MASPGVGMIGREVTAVIGGLTLAGTITKGTERTNERLDTTDDASSGWQEALAVPGVKGMTYTVSGLLKNLELVAFFHGQTSQMVSMVITYADGLTTPSTETLDAFFDSISDTGESNGLVTFDASFSSSGVVAYVAAT